MPTSTLYSIFSFLSHIIESDNSLLKDIYFSSKETNPWSKKVNKILNDLGLSYVIKNINTIKFNLSQIRQSINDQCLQTQNAKILDSPKLEFVQSVYKMGQRPPYVDILKSREDRASLCKIRISAHLLMIERGRHLNIPRDQRYCPICNNNEIESENRFFLKCTDVTRDVGASQRNVNIRHFSDVSKEKKKFGLFHLQLRDSYL